MTIRKEPLPLGTKTPWGKIDAIMCDGPDERRYFICRGSVVSLMPADVVEKAYDVEHEKGEVSEPTLPS